MRLSAVLSFWTLAGATALGATAPAVAADDAPAYGPELQGFDYPYPVAHFAFPSQRQTFDMAYMDVEPTTPNGHVVVLLHGKNFCAATWEGRISADRRGYRVIAPDQIGWCKSTKPEHYQYTFQQLRQHPRAADSLGITTPS